MEKRDFLYEGKAKKIWSTDDPKLVVVEYKDDATAFDGAKKGVIESKGVLNNRISGHLFAFLAAKGIPTHFEKLLDDRHMLVRRLDIIPVEVVVRNVVAGSLAKRLGLSEGTSLKRPIIEMYYKNDELHDPMINEYHALAMGWATEDELTQMKSLAFEINELLVPYFRRVNVDLVDFKLEFGRFEGRVLLGDEISPDTCRFWDADTGEKLDKDRFRRDLGKEREAYEEIWQRIKGI